MSSRGYIQEELTECTRWANHHLGVGGYSDDLITDLSADLADGITLLRLVQSLSGEPLPEHSSDPLLKVQRIENLSVALNYLHKTAGLHLPVHAEELAGGSVKASLAVCKALRRHYTAGPAVASARSRRGFSFSSLDKEDMSVLSWLGECLHRTLTDYTQLYDGRLLCDLINTLRESTFTSQEIASWSREQRVREALTASYTHFYISHSEIEVNKIASGSQDKHLRSYLQQMKTVQHSQQQQEQESYSGGLRAGSFSNLSEPATHRPLVKHSSTDALSQPLFSRPLNRHHSVDTGIAPVSRRPPPSALLRTMSQTIPQSLVDTPTFEVRGLSKRAPSTPRLDGGEELTSLVTALEERLATLTAQFLFERQDMYKRMDKALVRERKRRQAVEKRLRDIEGLAKRQLKHYDNSIIEIAKQVSRVQGEGCPTPVTREIAALKEKVAELAREQVSGRDTSQVAPRSSQQQGPRQRSHTLFVRKMQSNTDQQRSDNVFSRGSLTSFKKLSAFFGAEPPRLEDITTFLDGLGYSHLLPKFSAQDISLVELGVMSGEDLERLGVPLGPRLRILQELKSLKPLTQGTVI